MTTDDMILEALEAELHRAERRAEQAEGQVVEVKALCKGITGLLTAELRKTEQLTARAEQAEAALTKLRNVADQHIADAMGPVDEAFVFDVAYAATLAATTPGEPQPPWGCGKLVGHSDEGDPMPCEWGNLCETCRATTPGDEERREQMGKDYEASAG